MSVLLDSFRFVGQFLLLYNRFGCIFVGQFLLYSGFCCTTDSGVRLLYNSFPLFNTFVGQFCSCCS